MERRKSTVKTTGSGATDIRSADGRKSIHAAPRQPCAFSVRKSGFSPFSTPDYMMYTDDLFIERNVPGKPHKGKVLAAIQPHSDDIPLYAGGLVAKLIDEGYTGYLIRVSNDEVAGETLGHGVVQNEIDNNEIAKALDLKKAFSFYYRNHRMDDIAEIELRQRIIFLFRVLKVDTIVTMDPYDQYEMNPDHLVTSRAVEYATWMAGGRADYPEHIKAGIMPHSVNEKYYHSNSTRGLHWCNRIVDISSYIDKKVESNIANQGKGPAGSHGSQFRKRLANENKKLPVLGDDDRTADFQYVKEFLMKDWKILGEEFGLEYAEQFFYIGSETNYTQNFLDYAEKHSIPLH
ncbi:hypothetical protein ES708_14093 [subsurface metagenome]